MFYVLAFLFIVLPLSEIAVLIKVGSWAGLGNTILIIIGTGILGATLARAQGLKILFDIQNDLNQGAMPTDKLMDGFLILLAGIVLLTPGFITDVAGFFVLWPPGRRLVKQWITRLFEGRTRHDRGNIRHYRQDDI